MADISLLPDEARKREQQLPPSKKTETTPGGLKMHIPEAETDEDIEIIEVDEGDLGTVLADEPFLTRFMYQASTFAETMRRKLFASKASSAPPPKLPPQFFTPPRAGGAKLPPGAAGAMATRPGAAGAANARVRITPSAEVPRRVRVIKRVRKPVQVSLISEEDVLVYHIDIPKRRWTLGLLAVLFMALIGGGYWLLSMRTAEARAVLTELDRQISVTDSAISQAETKWSNYHDLQRRLVVLGDLMDQHVIVTRAFDLLEQRTVPTVGYRSATLSANGNLSLDVAANSYESAARQLVAFQESPEVIKVDASSFNAQIDGESGVPTLVSFQLTLQLSKEALREFSLPQIESVTVNP